MLDIEEHVDVIIQTRNGREQAGHIWHSGFYGLANESTLLGNNKVENYLASKLNEHPPFTKFVSSVQYLKLVRAMQENFDLSNESVPVNKIDINARRLEGILGLLGGKMKEITNIHLPVNEDYHLEFPLVSDGGKSKLIYTTCELCENLEEHGLPEICLRTSIDFGSDVPNMYDNRISVNRQSKELMIEMYSKFRDFVEATRIG